MSISLIYDIQIRPIVWKKYTLTQYFKGKIHPIPKTNISYVVSKGDNSKFE